MRWLHEREESGLARVLRSPLVPLSAGYALGARIHRRLYETWLQPRQVPLRVVSVGSPVVGGSGKTPVAAWLALQLARSGVRTALGSRGYRGAQRGLVEVVSDGHRIHSQAASIGDEALWLAGRVPGVPVLVARDRGLAAMRAHAWFGSELLVLDDGFHHHRLAKDAELLVLDGAFGLGNRRVLPRGPLREALEGLSHCDALLVLDSPLHPEDEAEFERLAPGIRKFTAVRRPTGLVPLGQRQILQASRIGEEPVGMLTAIGWPPGFRRTLEALGARVVAERVFRDHHRYRPQDLRGLGREAPRWITTEKDALKLRPEWLRGPSNQGPAEVDLYVLRQSLEFGEAESLLDWARGRVAPGMEARAQPLTPEAAEQLAP